MSVKIKIQGNVYKCRPNCHVLCTETTSKLAFSGVCLSNTETSTIGQYKETWKSSNFTKVRTEWFEFKQSIYEI